MKYTPRKRTRSRRKLVSRRRFNISRPLRQRATPVVSFKRTTYWGNWTPGTASTNQFWKYEGLSPLQIPNFAEYMALFDQYKINGIKVTFRPRYDNFAGNDTTDTTLPGVTNQAGTMIHFIVDPESSLTPSGAYTSAVLRTFMEQGNVRTRQGNKPFSIYFKPRIDSPITGGTQRIKAPWLQTKDNTVVHYGYHVFAQDVNMTGTFGQSWDLYATFYFQCRGMN